MKSKTYTLVVCLFVLTLGAGVAAGILVARLPGSSPPASNSPETSLLAEELQLTPEQEAQMKPLWEHVRTVAHDCLSSARKIQQERDDKVLALLTPDEQTKYKVISDDFVQKFTGLNKQRDDAFDEAVEKTMPLLNAGQQDRLKRIIQDRTGRAASENMTASAP